MPDYTTWLDKDIIEIGHMSAGAYKELVRRYLKLSLSDSDTDSAVRNKVSDSDTIWAWAGKEARREGKC